MLAMAFFVLFVSSWFANRVRPQAASNDFHVERLSDTPSACLGFFTTKLE
jgi:hypothetical protein